mmetsp:Transcript_31524/g.76919  ORF Transcript_31524/g.76919 Transcript_31524/m.76919 type:complete len:422 (-) Transcript_31524:419-1684(-)
MMDMRKISYKPGDLVGLQLIRGPYKGKFVDAVIVRPDGARYVVKVEDSKLGRKAGLVGRELGSVPAFVMRPRKLENSAPSTPAPPPPASTGVRGKAPPPPRGPPAPLVTSNADSKASSPKSVRSLKSPASESMEFGDQQVLTGDQLRKVQAKLEKWRRERVRRSQALLKVQKKNEALQVRVESLTTAIEMCGTKIATLRSKNQKSETEAKRLREENAELGAHITFLLRYANGGSILDPECKRLFDSITREFGQTKNEDIPNGTDPANTPDNEEGNADEKSYDAGDSEGKMSTTPNIASELQENDFIDGSNNELPSGSIDMKQIDSMSMMSNIDNGSLKTDDILGYASLPLDSTLSGVVVDSEPMVLKEGYLKLQLDIKMATRFFRVQEKPASPTYMLAWFKSQKKSNLFYQKVHVTAINLD